MQFYIVDANFIVANLLDANNITDPREKNRIQDAQCFWRKIEGQQKNGKAKVYVLDTCIAETFKVLSKIYYKKNSGIKDGNAYSKVRKKLKSQITLSAKEASSSKRKIVFHDFQTSRDIIIGVDRFFEKTFKKNAYVGILDLMILSLALYLIDFMGFDRDSIQIITMDKPLYKLARTYPELPSVFDPTLHPDHANKVFTP